MGVIGVNSYIQFGILFITKLELEIVSLLFFFPCGKNTTFKKKKKNKRSNRENYSLCEIFFLKDWKWVGEEDWWTLGKQSATNDAGQIVLGVRQLSHGVASINEERFHRGSKWKAELSRKQLYSACKIYVLLKCGAEAAPAHTRWPETINKCLREVYASLWILTRLDKISKRHPFGENDSFARFIFFKILIIPV